jgi:hypothetical protein
MYVSASNTSQKKAANKISGFFNRKKINLCSVQMFCARFYVCFRFFFFFAGAGGFVEAPSSTPIAW